jgi:hypothetical protein
VKQAMETKRDQLISLYVSERELRQIAGIAAVEKVSPNMWVRDVATKIAAKFTKLTSDDGI